jgi:DNA-directed RNA polymerase subunit omega
MIHPSFNELKEDVNNTRGEAPELKSRYTIVMAAAKRARQINDGSMPQVDFDPKDKNLSIAVKELQEGKLHLVDED